MNAKHAWDNNLLPHGNILNNLLPANSKFDLVQVESVRALHSDGYGYKRLAKMFGVSPSAIYRIVKGHSYAKT